MNKRYKPTFTGVTDFMVWAQDHPVLMDASYRWVPTKCLNDSLHAYFDVTDEVIHEINDYIAKNLYYFHLIPDNGFYVVDDSPSSVGYGKSSPASGYIAKTKRRFGGKSPDVEEN